MASANGFSPVQRRMMDLLETREWRTPKELHGCLHDELGDVKNIKPHLTALRGILRRRNQDVLCYRQDGRAFYRLIDVDPPAGLLQR